MTLVLRFFCSLFLEKEKMVLRIFFNKNGDFWKGMKVIFKKKNEHFVTIY